MRLDRTPIRIAIEATTYRAANRRTVGYDESATNERSSC